MLCVMCFLWYALFSSNTWHNIMNRLDLQIGTFLYWANGLWILLLFSSAWGGIHCYAITQKAHFYPLRRRCEMLCQVFGSKAELSWLALNIIVISFPHKEECSLILTVGCFQSPTSSWHLRGALPDSAGSCVWGTRVSPCLPDQGAGAQGVPARQRLLLGQSVQKSEPEWGRTQDGTSLPPHTHALLTHQWQQQHGGEGQSAGCVRGVSAAAQWADCVRAESPVLCGQLVGQAACPAAKESISSLPGHGQKQL